MKRTPLELLLRILIKPRYKKILITAGISLLLIFTVLISLKVFKVRSVVIDGPQEQGKILNLNLVTQSNLLFFPKRELEQKILETNPWIQSVSLIKKYPATVVVKVEEKEALGQIKAPSSYLTLSENGTITANVSEPMAITQISYYQTINPFTLPVSQKLDFTDIKVTLQILKKLKDLGVNMKTVDIRSFTMIVCNDGASEYVFTAEKSAESQVEIVKTLLIKSKITGEPFKKLDVRFNRPVVVY